MLDLRWSCALLIGIALPLPAQGGIRWSDSSRRPALWARRFVDGAGGVPVWGLCFPGWTATTFAPLGPGNEAAALGVDPGARSSNAVNVDVLREGAAGPLSVPTFPFVPDGRVVGMFRSAVPPGAHQWYGFLAPIGSPVPAYGMGALSFRVEFQTLAPAPPLLFTQLANAYVGVAVADANGGQAGTVFVRQPAAVRAAPIVDYRFDRGDGSTAINYAGVVGGAPSTGVMTPGGAPSWTSGRFGTALARGSSCDTMWAGDLSGSFSVGWYMHGPSNAAIASPIFSLGMFRCFTGQNAGTGLHCAAWGGSPAVLDLADDVQTAAVAGWVHVALVVDADSSPATASFYVDGTLRRTINITSPPVIQPSTTNTLLIGAFASGVPGRYDIDEFRFVGEAKSAADIAMWATSSPAVTSAYSPTCGANLRPNGPPTLGNTMLELRIEGTPGSAAALTLGVTTRLLGGIPLPIDLGLINPGLGGCLWYSDMTVSLPTSLANGLVDLPLPIPNDSALRGLDLHAQALVVEPTLLLAATNAQVLAID